MDWQIGPLSRKSSLDDRPFEPGDRAVTLLFMAPGGNLSRYDVHEDALTDAVSLPPGQELGRWVRRIKDPNDKSDGMKTRLENAEALFLSFFGERMEMDENGETVYVPSDPGEEAGDPGPDSGSENAAAITGTLKHLLALMLERKRILKPVGKRRVSGVQPYLHAKTRREYAVPVLELDEQVTQRLEAVLGELIF